MPDANREATVNALAGAAFGAAGQRCMAISAAVFVGGVGPWKDAMVAKAKSLKVGSCSGATEAKGCRDMIIENKRMPHTAYMSSRLQVICIYECRGALVSRAAQWLYAVAFVSNPSAARPRVSRQHRAPHTAHACTATLSRTQHRRPEHVSQVNAGYEDGADVGPLISPEAKARVERLIQSGVDQVQRSSGSCSACVFGAIGSFGTVLLVGFIGLSSVTTGQRFGCNVPHRAAKMNSMSAVADRPGFAQCSGVLRCCVARAVNE